MEQCQRNNIDKVIRGSWVVSGIGHKIKNSHQHKTRSALVKDDIISLKTSDTRRIFSVDIGENGIFARRNLLRDFDLLGEVQMTLERTLQFSIGLQLIA